MHYYRVDYRGIAFVRVSIDFRGLRSLSGPRDGSFMVYYANRKVSSLVRLMETKEGSPRFLM